MPVGVRELTVLGEFKPFGLIAEALDGSPPTYSNFPDKYDYFLFSPETVRDEAQDPGPSGFGPCLSGSDHELFIRGNKIIWSTGSRVFKRFTLKSPVITACWCRFGGMDEVLLCILEVHSLTIYSTLGEVVSIPLPWTITSIWPLPYGLLLQRAAEGNSPSQSPFSSSTASFGGRHASRVRKEIGNGPQHNFTFPGLIDGIIEGDSVSMSSHLILKDLTQEPQSTYVEERGRLSAMKDFDERTIWTSDSVPLMVSYNKGKMQHSLWVSEVITSDHNEANSTSTDLVPASILSKKFSFQRLWQAKGAQTASSKVFLATDDDAVPVICFLLQEQKKLLAVRLQGLDETNNEMIFDIKPEMSWSIPAIAASSVIVTRPRVKVGLLPHSDIIILDPENALFLYSGKQCLCRYLLPSRLRQHHFAHDVAFAETSPVSHEAKILGLVDAVDGRINVIVNGGQMFRCVLRKNPSSSLVSDCFMTMAQRCSSRLYHHFLMLFWGGGDSFCFPRADSTIDSEWESFCNIMLQMCTNSGAISGKRPKSVPVAESSWQFLINSTYHQHYRGLNFIAEISTEMSSNLGGVNDLDLNMEGKQSSEKSFCVELLLECLGALHVLYESLKLDCLRKLDLKLLALLLCDIANFIGEEGYIDYYVRDFPLLRGKIGMHQASSCRRSPPILFRWLENCLTYGCGSANMHDLPCLDSKEENSAVNWARKIVSFYTVLCGGEIVGKRLSSGVHCNIAAGSYRTSEELTVLAMVGEGFGLQQLDQLPSGVSLPLRHALDKCRESPPTDWPAAAYVLLGREDLALSCMAYSCKSKELETRPNVNLIFMSTPYMLHLHPVTVPSTVPESVGEATKFDNTDSADGSLIDGMEHIFSIYTQLRYGRDLRLNEVRRLLCSARPVAIQASVNPSASDQDAQQAQLWQLAQRTTALPLGRGAFTLGTISTLLTEVFTVPKLVLAGRLPAQQNATVNLDPNIRNIQELKSWPEFHNAVAAGLKLAPLQGKVSRTWIIYNKPEEPNAIHAGLLLALGLHGYLRVLVITDIYTYFTQEHESTTVGLMLGLAASYRGTMQPAISKSLYVHVPSRHSSSYPDLELPTLMQSAALVSIGLLYEGSMHLQTMQIVLSEIGRRSGGDNVLEREGYAVSAGFSLGLVALGRGKDAHGSMDSLVQRLLHYIGGQDSHNERSAFLVPSMDEYNRGAAQMMEGSAVNVDVTAPGAIIALALMFLKTESEEIFSRLSIPQTHFGLHYVRPDFIMLRVIARNLIMWSRVQPSRDWINSQIPEIVKSGVKGLGVDDSDIDEMDAETFVQAYVNVVAGACISLGLHFAGTKDGNVQELLYDYAVHFLNEIKPVSGTSGSIFPKGLSRYVDRGTLELCLHLIVLSLSVVMAGSGHITTLRLLRFLRSRNSADGHSNFGAQMVVSLAIGFLFLGGGMRTFSTSKSSIAALLITLYPRLPTGPNDNRCHLQAFRHLYVLASEARWIQTVDVDSGQPVYVPLEITIKETEHYSETSFCEVSPCILPERSTLKTVRVCGPRYWPQVIELVPEEKPWWSSGDKNNPFNAGVLFVKRKVGACSYVDDPIGCQSLLSRAMQKVTTMKTCDASVSCASGPCSVAVDHLVGTFSSDPSLISFAQLCSDPSWNTRYDADFQEFCLQILFECISKDRPGLLQVYLSFYTTIVLMAIQLTESTAFRDPIAISNLKLALAYNEALTSGRLTTARGGIIQSVFLGSLRKRLEELLNSSEELKNDLCSYLNVDGWPMGESCGERRSVFLSWYLQWFGVPAPCIIKTTMEKIKSKPALISVPLLRSLFPSTHVAAIFEMHKIFSSQVIG